MKSPRNKTIDISPDEGKEYLAECLRPSDAIDGEISLHNLLDRTVCGDIAEAAGVMPRGFADLAIVDPPYNLSKDFHGNAFRRTDDESYAAYTESWIGLIRPLLKPNASIYVCCDWRSSMTIGGVLGRHFKIQNRITWQREKGRGARANWKNCMEDIWFATNSAQYTFHADAVKQRRRVLAPYRKNGEPKDWEQSETGRWRDSYPSNFWDDISVPFWSMSENTAHPTQKPEKLIAKLILASSNEGDVVLDPFLGSGTTSVVAKKLGRHFVGVEQNERYCVWAQYRLRAAEQDRRIQGYTDGVFWDRNTLGEQAASRPSADRS